MRKFVIKGSRAFHMLDGLEFEVSDNAEEDTIAWAASDCVMERLDYTWTEVTEKD